jgi:hypothetical protein
MPGRQPGLEAPDERIQEVGEEHREGEQYEQMTKAIDEAKGGGHHEDRPHHAEGPEINAERHGCCRLARRMPSR